MSHRNAFALLLLLPVLVAACQPGDDQETGTISREDVQDSRADLDPAFLAALDSGNAAYRARDFEQALSYYREAIEIDDEVAAAWFGTYMAHLALGDQAGADSAMVRAQSLEPGASLIHPEPPDQP